MSFKRASTVFLVESLIPTGMIRVSQGQGDWRQATCGVVVETGHPNNQDVQGRESGEVEVSPCCRLSSSFGKGATHSNNCLMAFVQNKHLIWCVLLIVLIGPQHLMGRTGVC